LNLKSSITLAFKDAFSSGFAEAKGNLSGMKGALDEIGQNQSMNRLAADMAMMTSMTDPMRKALSEAMDQPSRIAGSLDTAFRNIQVATGSNNDEMAVLRRELLAIGGQAVGGPQRVAEAFGNVASGIADASKHMAVMNATVALAEANQTDLATSTSAMVNVMNAWNLSACDAALAADILTQTSIMGVGSLGEFAGYIGQVSTLAASAGIGLDELGASFAYITNTGMSAAQTKRQLNYLMQKLVSPSETLSKLYDSLGIESGHAMLQQYGLAESLNILKDALGGNEQAFAGMIGNAQTAMVALALTEDAYVDFATSFGEGMLGVTEAARGVQLESIEAKMARLDAVSQSLQAQVGQDINGIKGFFIDFQFGFLSNVVSPLMRSPVGGALSKIAAGTGMVVKGVLDFGSGAMATAAQMTTLAANISNAGGIAKLFKSAIGLAGSSLKIIAAPLKVVGVGFLGLGKSVFGALPGIKLYTASMWAAVAPTLAVTWPVLAVVAAVALLAGGVFLLVRNWETVPSFFTGLWGNIKEIFSTAVEWTTSKIAQLVAPFKMVGDLVGGVFSRIGGFFNGIGGRSRQSGGELSDAFASGIQDNVAAPGTAFGNSLEGVGRQMPHSDAKEGPLSELTTSGRALTETFASGMDETALKKKASIVFSAAMPKDETAIDFPLFEQPESQSGSQSVHIQNLYLQAEDCNSLLDFVRMLMHAVHRPQELPA
jgi:TP901 family phage tail tape measure protein